MAQLSTFLMVFIAFSLVMAGGFSVLMADLNDKYDVTEYNDSKLSEYNKLNEITQNTQSIKNKSMEMQSRSGVLDVLGGFVESAYDTIKISVSSFSLFNSMSSQAIENTGIENAGVFKTGITAILIIAIFLGIIVAAVIKTKI